MGSKGVNDLSTSVVSTLVSCFHICLVESGILPLIVTLCSQTSENSRCKLLSMGNWFVFIYFQIKEMMYKVVDSLHFVLAEVSKVCG